MVYVISQNGKPLMPCENVIARLLLKQGKAKVKRRIPFTIKLLYETTEYTQELTLGIDTGSSHIGSAVSDNDGNIYYMSDTEIRNDIADKMTQRAKYRRNRRYRKTRYRKARWMNRKNSIKTDRFSPTMRSKLHSHEKEIEFVKSILPLTRLVLETATFDPHLMKNPNLNNPVYRHWGYQQGNNYGFENTKVKVLNRDNYICQYCKGKKKDSKLEVHHIIYRSKGGSDEEENLITLCHTCHSDLHHDKIKMKLNGKAKGQLKHATQMNSIRIQLLRKHPEAIETFGYITKANRLLCGVKKSHYSDACMIASGGQHIHLKQNVILFKKCVSDGDYQQTKGVRSEQKIPTGKIDGFRKFDKVRYLGREYFIKGRMSSGYAILMDISGKKVDFSNSPKGWKTPKLSNCKRLSARKSWIISEQAIQNIV
jgi:5-methylcytosine-specific restriction endonuclease McrA